MRLEDEIAQKKFKNDYHKAAINIIYTHNWLVYFQNSMFKKHQLTLQQYNILRILRGRHSEPASIKVIRARMLDKMSDASRIVEKLRLKGLVERSISQRDRRNVDVIITQKGMELLARLDPIDDMISERMCTLNEEEIGQLNFLLDKLRG